MEEADYGKVESSLTSVSLDRLELWNAWILFGKADKVAELPAFDRYMILISRMMHKELSADMWKALAIEHRNKERNYVVNTLDLELIVFLLEGLRAGDPAVSGNDAGAQLFQGSAKYPVQLRFKKELGEWKVDLVTTLSDLFEHEFVRVSGDAYRNRNRVEELMMILYGERFSRSLYASPLERHD